MQNYLLKKIKKKNLFKFFLIITIVLLLKTVESIDSLANTDTIGKQYNPAIVKSPDGGFFIAWTTKIENIDKVVIQKFDRNHRKIGIDQFVTKFNNRIFPSSEPSMAILTSGKLVIVWNYFSLCNNDKQIFGKIYDSNLKIIYSEFFINTESVRDQHQPQICALPGDNFLVVYQDSAGNWDVNAIAYSSTKNVIKTTFKVNNYALYRQGGWKNNYCTSLNNGKILVTWASFMQDGSDWGIIGKIYYNDFTLFQNDFIISCNILNKQEYAHMAVFPYLSRIIYAWQSNHENTFTQIYFKITDSDNTTTIKDDTIVNIMSNNSKTMAKIFINIESNAIICWIENNYPYCRTINNNGDYVTNIWKLSNNQSDQLDLTVLTNGQGVIIYQDITGRDGSDNGIFFNSFYDFQLVNSFVEGIQEKSSVANTAEANKKNNNILKNKAASRKANFSNNETVYGIIEDNSRRNLIEIENNERNTKKEL